MSKKKENKEGIRKIGKILIKEGLVTEAQLQKALRVQKGLKENKTIGQILVEQKVITQKQLGFLLDRHNKRPRLGKILIQSGVITEEHLKIALEQQKAAGLRLGEMLVKLEFINE